MVPFFFLVFFPVAYFSRGLPSPKPETVRKGTQLGGLVDELDFGHGLHGARLFVRLADRPRELESERPLFRLALKRLSHVSFRVEWIGPKSHPIFGPRRSRQIFVF